MFLPRSKEKVRVRDSLSLSYQTFGNLCTIVCMNAKRLSPERSPDWLWPMTGTWVVWAALVARCPSAKGHYSRRKRIPSSEHDPRRLSSSKTPSASRSPERLIPTHPLLKFCEQARPRGLPGVTANRNADRSLRRSAPWSTLVCPATSMPALHMRPMLLHEA